MFFKKKEQYIKIDFIAILIFFINLCDHQRQTRSSHLLVLSSSVGNGQNWVRPRRRAQHVGTAEQQCIKSLGL